MGVLNLTIESAPTNPKDKANELLTTVIIKQVIIARLTSVLVIEFERDKE